MRNDVWGRSNDEVPPVQPFTYAYIESTGEIVRAGARINAKLCMLRTGVCSVQNKARR